ncbi:Predicted arabinose efflux permease, MFS family [Nonomuraea solani]|uniref:Predicted arabinose efflux permease, MFS family n=1 Tax=Nonomuraea solani TaxID=1144553 RepID=A0A1H6E1U3_9ACTN|nr:MFS transporter [Nonomuraea solani]SEG91580.1 Predicted arabinose efflux permease, MFS family [Nonomuraea solani]
MSEARNRRYATAVLLAHSVGTQVVTFVLRPTMSYRAIELDVPAALLGVLGASFAIAPLLLALPAGHAADRYGERRMAVAGALLLTAAGAAFLTLGHTVPGLVAAGILLGTGHLGCVIAQQALVANTTQRGGHDTAFGRYTFAASLGQAAGPVLISAFGGDQAIPDTGRIFLWACGLAVLLVLLSIPLARSPRPEPGERQDAMNVRSLLRRPGIAHALVTSCVVLAAVDITLVYLPALGTEQGLTAGTVGLLLTIRGLASMISRFFLGRLSRALGRRRLLVTSTVAAAAAMLITPLPMPLWLLVPVLVVLGFGLGVGQPLTMSWLAESAPPGLRGRAMSLRLVGNRTGQLLLPGAAGLVAAGMGAGGVLMITALGLGWAGVTARRLPADP